MRHAACTLAARRSVGRSALIGLLVFALLVYGGSSTLLRMLGPMHRHAPAAAGLLTPSLAALAGKFQEWHRQALPPSRSEQARQRERAAAWAVALEQFDDPGHARRHALGQAHEHVHGLFERHFHDPVDASVIALDGHGPSHAGADALNAAASLGSATLPLAMASLLIVPAPAGRHTCWPRPAPTAWHSLVPAPAERPPRG